MKLFIEKDGQYYSFLEGELKASSLKEQVEAQKLGSTVSVLL